MVLIVPSVETLRIRWKAFSKIKISPRGSTVTSIGLYSDAEVAGPPSPPLPPPATVVILPCATFLTRALPGSAIKRFAAVSSEIPLGLERLAEVAGPLSPKPMFELPAKVLIVPPLTLRTRLLLLSLM